MPKLRPIAATVAAALLAGGLSVRASLAESDTRTPAKPKAAEPKQGAHWAPFSLCLLDGKTRR